MKIDPADALNGFPERPQTSGKAANANGGTPADDSHKVKPAASVAKHAAAQTKQVAAELIEHAQNVAGAGLTSMAEELGGV
jgi:hypothetical protein